MVIDHRNPSPPSSRCCHDANDEGADAAAAAVADGGPRPSCGTSCGGSSGAVLHRAGPSSAADGWADRTRPGLGGRTAESAVCSRPADWWPVVASRYVDAGAAAADDGDGGGGAGRQHDDVPGGRRATAARVTGGGRAIPAD